MFFILEFCDGYIHSEMDTATKIDTESNSRRGVHVYDNFLGKYRR